MLLSTRSLEVDGWNDSSRLNMYSSRRACIPIGVYSKIDMPFLGVDSGDTVGCGDRNVRCAWRLGTHGWSSGARARRHGLGRVCTRQHA